MSKGIWNLIADIGKRSGISEILFNGPKSIFVEKDNHLVQINAHFSDEELKDFINDVALKNHKKCDEDHPILDGSLPDGSRINIIYSPYASQAPAISIRKHSKTITSFDLSNQIFGLSPRWVDFFKALVAAKTNLVISGGTAVGKTTFLNLIINEIPKHERLIVIEDTSELSISLPNVVRLESGGKILQTKTILTSRDLVKNSLRMRPDRIIIGESRGGEFFDLMQAMNTGHEGSMTSIHSNSAGDTISRMEMLFLLAGLEVPLLAIKKQISQTIQFIIHLSRNRSGQRIVNEILEISGMEGPTLLTHKIATHENDELKFSGIVPKCMDRLINTGHLPSNFFAHINDS